MSDDYYKSKQVLDDSRDSRMRKLSLCLYGCHLLGWSCPSDLHPDHTASDAGISDIEEDETNLTKSKEVTKTKDIRDYFQNNSSQEDYITYVSSSTSLSSTSDSKFSSPRFTRNMWSPIRSNDGTPPISQDENYDEQISCPSPETKYPKYLKSIGIRVDDPVQVAERNIVKFNEKKDGRSKVPPLTPAGRDMKKKDEKDYNGSGDCCTLEEFKAWTPNTGGWCDEPVQKSQSMEELEAIGKKYNRNIILEKMKHDYHVNVSNGFLSTQDYLEISSTFYYYIANKNSYIVNRAMAKAAANIYHS